MKKQVGIFSIRCSSGIKFFRGGRGRITRSFEVYFRFILFLQLRLKSVVFLGIEFWYWMCLEPEIVHKFLERYVYVLHFFKTISLNTMLRFYLFYFDMLYVWKTLFFIIFSMCFNVQIVIFCAKSISLCIDLVSFMVDFSLQDFHSVWVFNH